MNKALRDFQTRMYSAQFMTLAVISRGENDSGFHSADHHDMRVAPELTPVRGQKPSPVCGQIFLLSFLLQDCKHDHELSVFENVLATPRGKSLKKITCHRVLGMY